MIKLNVFVFVFPFSCFFLNIRFSFQFELEKGSILHARSIYMSFRIAIYIRVNAVADDRFYEATDVSFCCAEID